MTDSIKPEKQNAIIPSKNKSPHTDDLVDHYWGSMNHVTTLIRASELKAGLILSFYGILLNFVYQSTNSVLGLSKGDYFLYTVFGLWFITTVISVFYSVQCFIPKIEAKFDSNVFFYKDVISKFGDCKAFAKKFYSVSVDEAQLFEQLGEQIFIISKIAARKFKLVQRSIIFLAFGLILLLVVFIYGSLKMLY